MADARLAHHRKKQTPRPDEGGTSRNPPRTERLQLIAKIAQPLQAIIDIEKSWLISHGITSDSPKTMESETNQIGELLEVSWFHAF
jgi:hypothetical protein